MPKIRSVYDEELKMIENFRGNPQLRREYSEWCRKWRLAGPVRFAREILRTDPASGAPIQLSEDQIEFLEDLASGKVRLAIITAGRGSGKTFALAVYVIWRIFTHENYDIACMGGSRDQSDKIHSFITGWINNSDELKKYKLKLIEKEVKSLADSSATFHACSGTSIRGPHVMDVVIDEEASGEEAGGTKFIRAALWEVSTSSNIHIIKSSTCHFVHGDFIQTWNNAEKLGYKRYRWAIVKHISGEKDPYKIYTDMNPKNWRSNIPWMPEQNVPILRLDTSNDEWLVEALGGISISSGLVFNPNDIDSCVCTYCPDHDLQCIPYKEGYCPMVQSFLQLCGVPEGMIPVSNRLALMQFVKERILGIDWGEASPCAYSAVGRFRDFIFVLISQEFVGQTDSEKIRFASELAKNLQIEVIRPDPREWAYNNALSNLGFAVHKLFNVEGGKDKTQYVYTIKRYIERHMIVIPCVFEDLIRSLKQLSYDEHGVIRKQNDHSFDSLLYAMSYYGEVVGHSPFWRAMQKLTDTHTYELTEDDTQTKKETKTSEQDPWSKIWGGFNLWSDKK